MKKQYIRLFVFGVLVCTLFSCSQDKVETKKYKLSEKYYLTENTKDGALTVDIKLEIPVNYKDKDIIHQLRHSVITNAVGVDYVFLNNDEILPAFANELNKEYRGNNLPSLSDKYEDAMTFNNDFFLYGADMMNDGEIFSYQLDMYVYMGGAHGLRELIYSNFDLNAGGSQFKQENIFEEGSDDFLSDVIKQKIVEQNDSINSVDELDEIYWTDHIKPNDNFYITKDGITYVFNPYEIAPYVYGHTKVNLSFEEVKSVLRKDSPISYLVHNR